MLAEKQNQMALYLLQIHHQTSQQKHQVVMAEILFTVKTKNHDNTTFSNHRKFTTFFSNLHCGNGNHIWFAMVAT